MIRRYGSALGAALALSVLTLAPAARGGEEEKPKIGPKAEAKLKRLVAFYAGLKNFRADVAVNVAVEARGKRQEQTARLRAAMGRPNRFALRPAGEAAKQGGAVEVVCDGEKLYVHVAAMQQYTAQKAPANLDALFADPMIQAASRFLMLNLLLQSRSYDLLVEGVTAAVDAGSKEIEGTACSGLRFFQKDMIWEMWLAEGEQPLVRSLVLSPKLQGGAKAKITVTYTDWSTDGELPEGTFAFKPPASAKRIRSFTDHPLLGAAAPDFTLKLLDGGEAGLAAHRGKEIVVLDFWATWCGPCQRALPILVEVAEAHKDKGVVFYAVNQREPAEKIKPYLEKAKLTCAVALDSDGAVGAKYGVRGIPQSVIIGRDGTIEAVHVGAAPDLKERLTRELETLLAGKSLLAGEEEEKAGPPREKRAE